MGAPAREALQPHPTVMGVLPGARHSKEVSHYRFRTIPLVLLNPGGVHYLRVLIHSLDS